MRIESFTIAYIYSNHDLVRSRACQYNLPRHQLAQIVAKHVKSELSLELYEGALNQRIRSGSTLALHFNHM